MTKSPLTGADEILIGTPTEVLQRAAAHYNASEYAAASAICNEVIAQTPDNAEALHILGHIASKSGAMDVAVGYFTRAVSAIPTEPRFSRSFAAALENSGRVAQAILAWTQLLALEPEDSEALVRLGRLYFNIAKYNDAIAIYSRASKLMPDNREVRFALAAAQHQTGQLDEAIANYFALLSTEDNWATLRNNLGLALIDAKRVDEAAEILEEARRLEPNDAEIHNNLGVCLAHRGDRAEARSCFDKALRLRPDWPEGHLNLANVLRLENRYEEAIENYHKAIAGNPTDFRIHGSLALTQMNLNDPDAAIASYDLAIDLAPENPELRKGLGIAQLLKGDFPAGWRNYEARHDCEKQRNLGIPLWRGGDIGGASLLIHAEQGFGDTLQFCRYLKQIAARANAGQIVFECQRPLYRLLAKIEGADVVVSRGDSLPDTDYQVPLLNLPGIFGTTLETIPAYDRYLSVPECASVGPSSRQNGKMRIGIVWKGNPRRQDDDKRSCPIAAFEPLAERPDVAIVSLQTDTTITEESWLSQKGVQDLAVAFRDFADTAVHIDTLDLVVSVDTATAHLAGALGKPVWVLLGESADWRYLTDREDCPWYPSMQLFRQNKRGGWRESVGRLNQAVSSITGR